jgi:hypothetical protein
LHGCDGRMAYVVRLKVENWIFFFMVRGCKSDFSFFKRSIFSHFTVSSSMTYTAIAVSPLSLITWTKMTQKYLWQAASWTSKNWQTEGIKWFFIHTEFFHFCFILRLYKSFLFPLQTCFIFCALTFHKFKHTAKKIQPRFFSIPILQVFRSLIF